MAWIFRLLYCLADFNNTTIGPITLDLGLKADGVVQETLCAVLGLYFVPGTQIAAI